eukprot:CAMPEP_0171078830 /NCGR_PEP_ID=MMETSP0766_2-20121228/14880_1 /TAXON_ID=439317 /ORGANISM="Gambierdiscus australes, Strain CAWD 149" /LENGTH=514 /DNA_ID=CAMNT_0011535985 /DNA_START=53 /DNA_END=1595 /DNA_ORIENTATION=+
MSDSEDFDGSVSENSGAPESRAFPSTLRGTMRDPRVSKHPAALDVVDGQYVQAFMGTVIGLNTLAMAVETDYPDWPAWPIVDNVFLFIFVLELLLRLSKRGLTTAFCTSKKERWWNWLDTFIVVLGIADLWVAPLVMYGKKSQDISENSAMLRFLRLLRLLRLLRVFKMVKSLAAFIDSIKLMLGPFFLVITFLFGFNLFVSIALTHVLGHAEVPEEAALVQHFEAARGHFSDVLTSFFSLFQVITTDNWDTIAEPVIQLNRMWRLFFVFFIAFCSWTMISILTAVASDNVISATSGRQERQRTERERRTKEFYRLLREMFESADEDGNGLLDKAEFQALLETDSLKELLDTLEIHVKKEDLDEIWDMLDVARTGVLTIDEFVDGLAYFQEDQICTRHIAGLDFGIRRLEADLLKRFDSLKSTVNSQLEQNKVLLDALEQEEKVDKQQTLVLSLWLHDTTNKDPDSFPTDVKEVAVERGARGHQRSEQAVPTRSAAMMVMNGQDLELLPLLRSR